MSQVPVEDVKRKSATSHEVCHSPEFKAFCQRFGIAHGLPHTKMVITLELDQLMMVEQTYQGSVEPPTKGIDTTHQHNKTWRTFLPNPRTPEECSLGVTEAVMQNRKPTESNDV